MSKNYIYLVIVSDDCTYQEAIIGIMDSEERAEELIARIKKKTDSYDLTHVDIYIKTYEINKIDKDILMYNNLLI